MSVRAKKHLGQHFLNDLGIAEKIVNSLSWNNYSHVLEVGPGMGVLTQFLIEQKKEVSVMEIDRESVEYLNQKYNMIREELPIYSEDFLKADLSKIKEDSFAILGNFPYNISSQILFKVLENKEIVPEVVGMFQKEVAERISASHGNKTYGILSVLIQAYYKTEYLFTVDEKVFNPPPKVKSGVIKLERYRDEIDGVSYKELKKIVKAGFNHRRKTLRNCLKGFNIPEEHKDNNFFNLRAEQLSVEDFINLTKIMNS